MQSMIISWLITGIVIGIFSALVPTYISEISLIYICGALESANHFYSSWNVSYSVTYIVISLGFV
jgi:flagellar biosynthesis protein FliQ